MSKPENEAMKELVQKGRLKRADILLTRTKGSLLGRLIRFGTESYWNHALMVYTIKDDKQGYDHTYIIESGGAGIDIHNIAHYLEKPQRYDVAVKRLETDWFKDDSEEGGLRYRRKVRGFALREIDDKYDHRMIVGIAARLLRQIILAILFPLQRRKPREQRRVRVSRIAGLDVNAYICSGFVQWAYYQGISKIFDEDNLDKSKLEDIIFNPRVAGEVTEDDLLSTTPADLANSEKLSWKYIIKDGKFAEVSSKKEVDAITEPNKKA
jgi:hypothetical protein